MKLTIIGNVGFTRSTVGEIRGPWTIGGAAYGIALGAAYGGLFPAICSVVGSDLTDKTLLSISRSINIENIQKHPSLLSGRFDFNYFEHNTNPNVITEFNALTNMQYLVKSQNIQSTWVHICAMKPLRNIDNIHALYPSKNVSISFIKSSILAMLGTSNKTVSNARLLFFNKSEWNDVQLRPEYSQNMTSSMVVVTSKENVSLFQGGYLMFSVKTAKINNIVDTTGAGDIFAGTVIARVVLGDSLSKAILEGIKAAQIAVTGWGLTKIELELFGHSHVF